MSTEEFQSIEDFEREHAARQASNTPQPQESKRKTKLVDFDALRLEQEAIAEVGGANWTGKLNEYRAANPVATEGLKYLDQVLGGSQGPRFQCIAVIAETSDQFGAGVSFSNKKAARQFASKKAVDWLISNEKMPADGSVRFPKPVQPPPQPSSSTSSISYGSQVPDLCFKLGFNPPTYRFEEPVPQTALYDAWADFENDPRVDGRVGQVRGVYGKKSAKQEVAKIVIEFLKDIERRRKQDPEVDEEEEEEEEGGEEEGGGEEGEEEVKTRGTKRFASPIGPPGKAIKVEA